MVYSRKIWYTYIKQKCNYFNIMVVTMKNSYETKGSVTEIILNTIVNGENLRTVIDTNDLHLVKDYKGTWVARPTPYEGRYYVVMQTKAKLHWLHRVITNCPYNYIVDHINHDTLNNRRVNLRNVTAIENGQNKSRYNKTREQLFRTDWNAEKEMYALSIRDKESKKFVFNSFYPTRKEAHNKAKELLII